MNIGPHWPGGLLPMVVANASYVAVLLLWPLHLVTVFALSGRWPHLSRQQIAGRSLAAGCVAGVLGLILNVAHSLVGMGVVMDILFFVVAALIQGVVVTSGIFSAVARKPMALADGVPPRVKME